jgi:uncharacterized protein Usg
MKNLDLKDLEILVTTQDFQKQVEGYGLTTANILYRRPDHPWLLQSYVWQNYDLYPDFPELRSFLGFWQKSLEGVLHSVTVAHSRLDTAIPSIGSLSLLLFLVPKNSVPVIPICFRNRFLALAPTVTCG